MEFVRVKKQNRGGGTNRNMNPEVSVQRNGILRLNEAAAVAIEKEYPDIKGMNLFWASESRCMAMEPTAVPDEDTYSWQRQHRKSSQGGACVAAISFAKEIGLVKMTGMAGKRRFPLEVSRDYPGMYLIFIG